MGVLFRQWLFNIIDKLQQLLCCCRLSVRGTKCGQNGVTAVSWVEGCVCARSNVEVLQVAVLRVGIRQTHERRAVVNMSLPQMLNVLSFAVSFGTSFRYEASSWRTLCVPYRTDLQRLDWHDLLSTENWFLIRVIRSRRMEIWGGRVCHTCGREKKCMQDFRGRGNSRKETTWKT